jgi:copper transport protein
VNESIFAATPLTGFAARWLTFAGVFLAFGSVVFRIAVLGRAALQRETAMSLARRAAACGGVGAGAVLLGALARLYFQTAEMRFPGDPLLPVATNLLAHTSWGWLWLAQVVLAILLAGVLHLVARAESTLLWRIAAVLALGLTITPALTSHAMSGHTVSRYITLPADMLHLLGASAWLGTLAVMFIALWRQRAAGGASHASRAPDTSHASDSGAPALAALLVYFSPLALFGAAAVVASGVVASYAHLGSVDNLLRSTYGRLLLVKVAVVLTVVAFGWRNWKRMTPRLNELGDRAMLRSVAGEVLLAMLVLAVTAALVITPPPTGMAG